MECYLKNAMARETWLQFPHTKALTTLWERGWERGRERERGGENWVYHQKCWKFFGLSTHAWEYMLIYPAVIMLEIDPYRDRNSCCAWEDTTTTSLRKYCSNKREHKL